MDQIELKIILFGTKNTFFVEMLFAEKTLSEDIILNEVSLGGSPTIDFALNGPKALSTLTHSTPLVQSRGFNNF